MSTPRLLILFVDALGPAQLEAFRESFTGLPHRRSLGGILGYSTGALPTLLTGAPPAVHGRMCLFARHEPGLGPSPLRPLRWLGLLPRVLHERGALRRRVGQLFARAAGYTGYVALHRVPPRDFEWLSLPEREDLWNAPTIGGELTFLERARQAGLSVYTAPWQLPEAARWAHAEEQLRRDAPQLSFLYAPEMDGALHAHGNDSQQARAAARRIGERLARARELLSRGGDVTTLVVGDHGMADVHTVVDPRPATDSLHGVRVFVDSTMVRLWGQPASLARARATFERVRLPGRWLDTPALRERQAPTHGSPFGDAIWVMPEGALLAPSHLGGAVRGMHGYDLPSPSTAAALASDAPLPDSVRCLADVAPFVQKHLGIAEPSTLAKSSNTTSGPIAARYSTAA